MNSDPQVCASSGVPELSIGGVIDGPSVRHLKDAQRLGLVCRLRLPNGSPARAGSPARCYARKFPDHAERELAQGEESPWQTTPNRAVWGLAPPAFRIISSGAKWQSGYSDLNRNFSCSQSRCHDQVRRYPVYFGCRQELLFLSRVCDLSAKPDDGLGRVGLDSRGHYCDDFRPNGGLLQSSQIRKHNTFSRDNENR